MRINIHGAFRDHGLRKLFEQKLTNENVRNEKQQSPGHYFPGEVTIDKLSGADGGEVRIRGFAEIKANGYYEMIIRLSIRELLVLMGDGIGDTTLRELLEPHKEGTEANPAA